MLPALAIFSYVLIYGLLAALAWSDIKTFLLPNGLNAALALSFMSFHISTGWHILTPSQAVAGAIVGGGFLLIARFLAKHFGKEDAVGLGDVKLMAAAGLGLGVPAVLLSLSLGAFFGLLHGAFIAWRQEKLTGTAPNLSTVNVPAGAGLALGIACIMATHFGLFWRGVS